MSDKGVNLDALIPREDFATDGGSPTGNTDLTIGVHHLANNNFFTGNLRKPDFQRETTNWTPKKIVELVESFLDAKLIPAIILWQSGRFNFVIDGAHRLSAMLAWIYDDYGDKRRSLAFFDNNIPEEQRKLADQTRKLINENIGPFSEFNDAMSAMFDAPEHLRERLSNMSRQSFTAQWVRETDAEGAQNSFFQINQQGTPLDATEKRILKARNSATAIATRAITRAGGGHPYWKAFDRKKAAEITSLGKEIHDALYKPPLGGMPIKSSDVPVAGRGYNALPFIFDLVNVSNSVLVADSTTKQAVVEQFTVDENGDQTVLFLKNVRKKIRLITTTDPASLGLHPLVYFYTRSGRFQPAAFHAIAEFIDSLIIGKRLDKFTENRARFESFLLEYKEIYSLIVTKRGSGKRSRPALLEFFDSVLSLMVSGKSDAAILEKLGENSLFVTLLTPQPDRSERGKSGVFSTSVKTAAFIQELTVNGTRCGICKALIHRNSMHTDHVISRESGGGAHVGNAQIAHPYCNSGYKNKKDRQQA